MNEKIIINMIEKLKGTISDSVLAELPSVMEKFQINTAERLAHFLGQVADESGGFKRTVEDLYYPADRLLVIFPHYFKTIEDTVGYAMNPEKIANKVYANRLGNGDEASGDGWKYRGHGDIQLTGKTNHQAFFKAIGVDINSDPSLVATKYPILSAAWYWNIKGLNTKADLGVSDKIILAETKGVNGGVIGLKDRTTETKLFYSKLIS